MRVLPTAETVCQIRYHSVMAQDQVKRLDEEAAAEARKTADSIRALSRKPVTADLEALVRQDRDLRLPARS